MCDPAARLAELQAYARAQIPLAAAMQLELVAWTDGELRARAPLAPNRNHHGTAFGGSQFALAAVAGWALIRLALEDAGAAGDAVVQQVDLRYLRPLRGDLELSAALTDPHRFRHNLQRHRRFPALLRAQLHETGGSAMRCDARYFVTLRND